MVFGSDLTFRRQETHFSQQEQEQGHLIFVPPLAGTSMRWSRRQWDIEQL